MAGLLDAAVAAGAADQMPGACPYCSGPWSFVAHGGPCPRVEAVEYWPNGSVKKVTLRPVDPAPPPPQERA
jgi:hypothetical protein